MSSHGGVKEHGKPQAPNRKKQESGCQDESGQGGLHLRGQQSGPSKPTQVKQKIPNILKNIFQTVRNVLRTSSTGSLTS